MGMMGGGMGLITVLGIAALLIVSVIALKLASRVMDGGFDYRSWTGGGEKPKRKHAEFILADDGELLEIEDDEAMIDQKSKRIDTHSQT